MLNTCCLLTPFQEYLRKYPLYTPTNTENKWMKLEARKNKARGCLMIPRKHSVKGLLSKFLFTFSLFSSLSQYFLTLY